MLNPLRDIVLLGARFRPFIAALSVIGTVFAVMGLDRLTVDTSSDSLILEDDPQKQIYERVTQEFGSDSVTLIYVQDPELWTTARLTALQQLHYALEDLDFVDRVESLYTVSSVRNVGDFVEVQPLLAQVPQDEETIRRALENAHYSPLIRKNFISDDGHATVLNVSYAIGETDPFEDARRQAAFAQLVETYDEIFDEVFQIGGPRINHELQTSLFHDLRLLGPLSAGVLMASIMLFLRSGFAALLPLFTAGLTIIWVFGLMGWIGVPLNILSAMLPSLIIVMGSTENTHILAGYLHALQNEDVSGQEASRLRFKLTLSTMKQLGAPLILATLTTVIGLSTNIFADTALIADFGIAATLALAINGVLTLFCVPMILATIGPIKPPAPNRRHVLGTLSGRLLQLLNYLRIRHGNLVLVVTLVLSIVLTWVASQMHVSNDPLAYFKAGHPLIEQADTVHEQLAGMQMFYIHLESDTPDAFRKPEYMQRILSVESALRHQGHFDQIISIADYVALINREWQDGESDAYRVPDNEALIQQYLLFFHQRDIGRYISHDGRRANIIVRHNIRDSYRMNQVLDEMDRLVGSEMGGLARHHFVGENLMINAAAEEMMGAQLKSLAILAAVVFLMMSLLFTSFRGGIMSMVPNILPIIFTFGLMTAIGVPINPGTATVAVIALGIAIDDTIHLLTRYNEEARRTTDPEEAIQKTLRAEAVPVISTSVSLMLGFACLLASDFSIIAQFGALSAAAMLFALLADLLITPILMSRIRLVSLWDILALRLDPTVIRNSELFANMTPYQIRTAILLCHVRSFERGQTIIQQGAVESEMYMVLSGSVDILLHHGDRETYLASSPPGAILGEVGFVGPIKRTAEVRAATKVEMLVFEAGPMRASMRFYPHIAAKINLNIGSILGTRLAENIMRLRMYADDRRRSPRFDFSLQATAITPTGKYSGRFRNISADGGVLSLLGYEFSGEERVTLQVGEISELPAEVLRSENGLLVLRFLPDADTKKELQLLLQEKTDAAIG